jgi:hypothetical protein
VRRRGDQALPLPIYFWGRKDRDREEKEIYIIFNLK